jgi:hypothetical protein
MLTLAGAQSVPEDQQRTIEVSIKDKNAKLSVLHLGVAKVADRPVLLVWTNGKAPALVTTLVETDDAKDYPLDLDAQKVGGNEARLIATVLGRYRAAFNIAAQD